MNSLPEGLITLTGDTNLISVDPEVIARLWRSTYLLLLFLICLDKSLLLPANCLLVYNTNPSIHPGIVGHRLENFFWRIWGSSILRSSLDGSTLARLFERISDTSYQVEGVVVSKPDPSSV